MGQKYIISEGQDFEVEWHSRQFGAGAPVNVLKFSGTDGSTTLNGVPIFTYAQLVAKAHLGRNGAGAVTFSGVKVGDRIVSATNLTTPGDVTSSFESKVSVAGQIQQTAATDLSLAQILFVVVKQS